MDPVLSTIVAALIAAVAAMWKKLSSDHNKLAVRNDECEQDRAAIRTELTEIKEDVTLFKSCPCEPCGAREALLRRQAFDSMLRYENQQAETFLPPH